MFTNKYNSTLPTGFWYFFFNFPLTKITCVDGRTIRILEFGIVKHIKNKYDGVELKNGVPIKESDGWRKGFIKAIIII